MKNYKDQEPRSVAFLVSDYTDAAESVNIHALEHAGKSDARYVSFLRGVIAELEAYAADTQVTIDREEEEEA